MFTVIWGILLTLFVSISILIRKLLLNLLIPMVILFAYFVTLGVNIMARKYFFSGIILFHFLNNLGLILRAVCRRLNRTIKVRSCLIDLLFLATLLLDHALRLTHDIVLFLLLVQFVNYLNLVCFVKLFNFHEFFHCLVAKCRLKMPMMLGSSEFFEAIGGVMTWKRPYLWYIDELSGRLFVGVCVLICLNCDWILQVA